MTSRRVTSGRMASATNDPLHRRSAMKRWMGKRWMSTPVAAIALTACVTINVYFPAAEAKEAAKEFVEKVIGEDAAKTPDEGGDGGMASLLQRLDPLSL